ARQDDVLMDTDDPLPRRASDSKIQTLCGALTALNEDDLVRRAITKARRCKEIRMQEFVIRDAGDERQRQFSSFIMKILERAHGRTSQERSLAHKVMTETKWDPAQRAIRLSQPCW